MDTLKEYIPFLIIVASFIISIVRSSKKKNKEDANKTLLPRGIGDENTSQQRSSGTFVPSQPTRPVQREYDVWGNNDVAPLSSEPVSEVIKRKAKVLRAESTLTDIPDSSPVFMEPEAGPLPFLDVRNTDELKKAIIYSEILQRKDF